MGAFDTIAKGALSQFGREFGRAAANSLLQGKNSQKIELTENYIGRIKTSDSSVIRAIKTIQKVEFVIQDKANASRLIDITDEFINVNKFNGVDTLLNINDYSILADIYNDKFTHGSALISTDFKDKVMDLLEVKRNELKQTVDDFNEGCKQFVDEQLIIWNQKKVTKKKLLIWAFPIWGLLGIHNFYLGKLGQGIFQFLFCWTFIPAIFNIIEYSKLISMNDANFDWKYNPEFAFFSIFKFSE